MDSAAKYDDRASSSENYRLGDWSEKGTIELTASGADAATAVTAALQGVLAVAGEDRTDSGRVDDAASSSAAIRGQGASLASVFAELAADLLAQLDANGRGLNQIRLDGLLDTDDGYTAWGYLVGTARLDPPPIGLALDDDPIVTEANGEMTLRCRLRRTA